MLERMPHLIGRQTASTAGALKVEVENLSEVPAYNVRVTLLFLPSEQLASSEWRLVHPLTPGAKGDEEIPLAIPQEQWVESKAYVIQIIYEAFGRRFRAHYRQYQLPTDRRPQSAYWLIDDDGRTVEQLL